jgi:GNAT superfamily N-acetyltransferase
MNKVIKVFSMGKVLNKNLYHQLQILESSVPEFKGAGNEFKQNRDWWVIKGDNDVINAYCGCLYSEGVCIFNRAWVRKQYRGLGIQKKLIKIRLKAARGFKVITYTTPCNIPSANNLIKAGFILYNPEYKYAGSGMLYFRKVDV